MKRHQSGFTLIEIAIVLVIIGLLLGGVLKGQELINSAKVKNLASDFKNTSLFIYSYQDKYHALPGDDALAASHVTGATTAAVAKRGDGKIDGAWNSTTATDESFLFWQHVRLSGIAAGVTDTTDTTGYPQRNTSGGLLGVTNSTDMVITGANGNLKGSYIICSTGILGKFAKQLDIALDDGNTATGTMMSISGTASPANADANPDDAALFTVCQGV
ncbi:MAG: prepilin-type N-terminal cleavage/methylation domain-containing protein [Gallionellales bacterium GWA2_60_142]|nr:MAG: prepilin-type N-terminal cleavage/methylation domain-containing protein [Gallionellales bacterium GWA2_60_142]HCI14631.1 prepilin-type cleavage/methylation domain-containing protein [Gallionellaceae bacterium]